MILTLLRYQLLLVYRQRSELMYSVLFFLLVVSLFPLAIGSDAEILNAIGSGVIWVAILLASLLSASSLFSSDFYDGTLEQGLLSSHGALYYVLPKIIAHWLVTAIPLLILVPFCGLILFLPADQIMILWLTILIGTPALSLLSAMVVAFTIGLRQGGILLALLLLPLYVPILILATSAVMASANGLPVLPHLALLTAYLLIVAVTAPFVTVYALKQVL